MGRSIVVERLDKRLDDGNGAVEGAAVAPGFQKVGLRNMPVAVGGGFILFQAEVDAQLDLLQVFGKLKIGWRGEGWISTEHDQEIHLTGRHILDKLAQ